MDFNLDVGYRGGISVVKVSGDVDMYTAPILDACLQRLVVAGKAELAVDLEDCSYFDSEGVKVLIRALRSAGEPAQLTVCGAQRAVSRVFEVSGLGRIFRILASVEDLGST